MFRWRRRTWAGQSTYLTTSGASYQPPKSAQAMRCLRCDCWDQHGWAHRHHAGKACECNFPTDWIRFGKADRLQQMDIQTCIDAYIELSKTVFTPRKRNRVFGRVFQNVIGNAAFNHKALEQAIKKIVSQSQGDEDAPLLEDEPKCKV